MEFPSHPFWDFALEVYRKPGVGDACLRLQEGQHLDVNLLLFVSWIGASGSGALTRQDIQQCMAAVGSWHEQVVKPLRGVRRIMKGGFATAPADLSDQLRRAIQAREIDAEHIEQLILTATILRQPDTALPVTERLRHAGFNTLIYLTVLGAVVDDEAKASLAVVLAAAFSNMAPKDIRAVLDASAA